MNQVLTVERKRTEYKLTIDSALYKGEAPSNERAWRGDGREI